MRPPATWPQVRRGRDPRPGMRGVGLGGARGLTGRGRPAGAGPPWEGRFGSASPRAPRRGDPARARALGFPRGGL